MDAYVHTTEYYKGYAIIIQNDTDPSNPREWDNLGTMLCFHRRYNLGDDQKQVEADIEAATRTRLPASLADEYLPSYFTNSENFTGWGDMADQLEKALDLAAILPLYLYDHSGITISTGSFRDPWDSGQVGFIFISKDKAREEYGWKRINRARRAQLEARLTAEVEEYDQYLTGDVWGYHIHQPDPADLEEVDTDDLDPDEVENWDEKDSCWGFYGSEYCLTEARSTVDYYVKEG